MDWRWSSHQAVLGKVAPPPYLDVEWTLGQFANKTELARQAYAEFVAAYWHRPERRGQAPGQDPTGRGPDGPVREP